MHLLKRQLQFHNKLAIGHKLHSTSMQIELLLGRKKPLH